MKEDKKGNRKGEQRETRARERRLSRLLLLEMDWSAAGREGWKQANQRTSIEGPGRIGLASSLNELDLMIRKRDFRGFENTRKDKREKHGEKR